MRRGSSVSSGVTTGNIVVVRDIEAPGHLHIRGPSADTNSWAGRNNAIGNGRAGGEKEWAARVAQVDPVEAAIDQQGVAESARTAGEQMQRRSAAQRGHTRHASFGRKRPDEHCARAVLGVSDDVEATMHAVDQVHVGAAYRAEHPLCPTVLPPVGVRRGIFDPAVRFSFDDTPNEHLAVEAAHQALAEEPARDGERLIGKEGGR